MSSRVDHMLMQSENSEDGPASFSILHAWGSEAKKKGRQDPEPSKVADIS